MEQGLKFSYNKDNEMTISGVNTFNLAEKYGTPLYVMNDAVIRSRCETFKNILSELYPNSVVSYASKAFCCKAIYKIINDYDFACDVVSAGEIYTATKAKFPVDKIYFHGNNKTDFEIDVALKNKIYNFIVDNTSELDTLLTRVQQNKSLEGKINIIVRVNPGVEAHTHEYIQTSKTDSKFGINIDSPEAEKFVVKVAKEKSLNLVGLHCHIGSQIFDYAPYQVATKKLMAFASTLKAKHKIDISVINMGGGFGVWYTDEDPVLKDEDYKRFIKAIVDEIESSVKENNLIAPKLVIEPGRAIVAEAGTTLYRVGNIKEIKDVRKYVSIDGGMFENPRYALYQAKYTALKCKKGSLKLEKVTIVGKCCESGDCIIKDAKLEKVEKGDLIAVLSTGAYNYSMASNYNRNPVPPVVLVNEGKSKLIVKGQTYKDLIKYDM